MAAVLQERIEQRALLPHVAKREIGRTVIHIGRDAELRRARTIHFEVIGAGIGMCRKIKAVRGTERSVGPEVLPGTRHISRFTGMGIDKRKPPETLLTFAAQHGYLGALRGVPKLVDANPSPLFGIAVSQAYHLTVHGAGHESLFVEREHGVYHGIG